MRSLNMSGLSEAFEYYEYQLDSNEATRSYSSSYSSKIWPTFIFENPLSDVIGIKVLEVEVPYSFYNVNETNNTFVYEEEAPFASHLITIPVGNYTAATLATAVHDALNTLSPPSWTVTFSNVTGKFSFSNTPATSFRFVFGDPGNDGTTNMRLLLGFNAGATAFVTSMTAPSVGQVTGPDYLFVNSTMLGSAVRLHLPEQDQRSRGGIGPEIAKIPINANPFGVIVWSDPSPNFFFATPNLFTLQHLDMFITVGRSQEPCNFNGLGFSVKLALLKRSDSQYRQYLNVRTIGAR